MNRHAYTHMYVRKSSISTYAVCMCTRIHVCTYANCMFMYVHHYMHVNTCVSFFVEVGCLNLHIVCHRCACVPSSLTRTKRALNAGVAPQLDHFVQIAHIRGRVHHQFAFLVCLHLGWQPSRDELPQLRHSVVPQVALCKHHTHMQASK